MEYLYGIVPINPAWRFDQYLRSPQGIELLDLKGRKGHDMTYLFSVIPTWLLVAQAVLIAGMIVGQIGGK
jgi:hypothetical protein